MAEITIGNNIASNGILSSSSSTYSTVRNGNNLSVSAWGNTNQVGAGAHSFFTPNYLIARFWEHFDLSTLPASATITSAFLRFVGTNTYNANTNTDTIDIVDSTVTSEDTLLTSDWGNIGSTSWGEIAMASWNNAGNNDISLNATGLAALEADRAGGFFRCGIRSRRDIANSAPTGGNGQTFSGVGELHIVYTVASGGNIMFFSNGGGTLG